MAITLAFASQKGGVGKTTSAVSLGSALAERGQRVLLVDFDSQGNLSSAVGADRSRPDVYRLIGGEVGLADVVQTTAQERLHVIPSGPDLTGANVELVTQENRQAFLKTAIQDTATEYDYVFIDSPPSLGLLTINVLTAADGVLIPLQCEYFAMEGLSQLLQNIKKIQNSFNRRLDMFGILFTMYDSRTRLANDVVQEVIGYFGKRVFRTIIPRNVRLSEAPSHGLPINLYDPSSVGARSYDKLADEVLERATTAAAR